MALAGIHNVSVLDSSFHRESQSPIPRRWANQDRPSNGPSSVLRMWRDLEGEHSVTHPRPRLEERPSQLGSDVSSIEFVGTFLSEGEGIGTSPQGQMGPQNEHEDSNSFTSELSNDFSEIERERVRQIFREWTNNGGSRGHESNGPRMSNCSRAQLLGENEQERVRVVREWVEMTTQQRATSRDGDGEEEQQDPGSQIERVRNGLVVNNQCEIGCRRAIRKLCGRQALIDLLARAERERKRELQSLLEHRPVSDFSHRNRIQSLLRGRFLRNKRFVQEEMSPSLAASELGLLRRRHTVSGLRLLNELKAGELRIKLFQVDKKGFEAHRWKREGFLSRVDNFVPSSLGSDQSDTSSIDGINGHRNEQARANILEVAPDEISNDGIDARLSNTDHFENNTGRSTNLEESTPYIEERPEQVFRNEEREIYSSGENVVGSGNEWSQETLRDEGNAQGTMQEAHEVFREQDEPRSEERLVQGQFGHSETSIVEDFNWQDMSAQEEEWQDSAEWRDNTGEIESRENTHQWYEETTGNDDIGQSDLQGMHQEWHENDVPSGQEVAVNERVNTFYFTDDDNQSNLELRELLSRRRVSNLLQSGFRESLDQLIQSYVQRQGHASLAWEQEMEQQSGDQNVDELDSIERTPLGLPPPPVTTPTLWDQDLHDATWQRPNTRQRLGIDIVSNIDQELQQRMNNMQSLLEACMDMQLELQRSVRQEVSAALNRSSSSSPEACGDSSPEDESKWDHVRKGICCICCDSNIDSLLYRCGHMCTCSKCADNLVQGRGKCPMCRAPVVEVIRAYSIM
ncbi:hypothetical protein LguiB_001103 [Lonicera macranthoides]